MKGFGILLCICTMTWCAAALNQRQCLADLRSGHLRTLTNDNRSLGLDIFGKPVDDANAAAISYLDCVAFCPGGDGQEPFVWSIFTRQFAAWLLPWLALLSQLPFGAEFKIDNIISVILTVGSPVLAAYSIVLTTLNGSHVASRFSRTTFPNTANAVTVLAGLQQSSIEVSSGDGLLASLVILPENDKWWSTMTSLTSHEHTWSISALSGIAWVVVAYLLTLLDAFTDITMSRSRINSDGPAVGSLWLWLLSVVVGWLVISPKCDAVEIKNALNKTNGLAHVAQDDGTACLVSEKSGPGSHQAITLKPRGSTVLHDELRSPPIFNYSRVFAWSIWVDQVAETFDVADKRLRSRNSVSQQAWIKIDDLTESISPENRKGTKKQVIEYCQHQSTLNVAMTARWARGVWTRMAIASFLALMLQWYTSGAAAIIMLYSGNARGMGCRSGSYLLYGLVSSVVWMLLVSSSIIAHYCKTSMPPRKQWASSYSTHPFLREFAVSLNILGKVLSVLNATWIICTSVFHFTNTYNRCICNSGIWGGQGTAKSYNVLTLTERSKAEMMYIWVAAISMTVVASAIFVGFVEIKRRSSRRNRFSSVTMI